MAAAGAGGLSLNAGPEAMLNHGAGTPRPRAPGRLQRWPWAEDADPKLRAHRPPLHSKRSASSASSACGWARDHGPLPPHVLGRCGHAVVPWHRGRRHATAALAALLPLARTHGLPFIKLTTDPDNLPSQRVMLRNGAVLVEPFDKARPTAMPQGCAFASRWLE